MTSHDIFSKIASHQLTGVMIHSDMCDYFDYLDLMGFKRMHEYQFLSETLEMRGTHRYYINHYNMLLRVEPITDVSEIPENWFTYTRQQVDGATKQKAVKNAFDNWRKWESETKKLYEKSYQDLCEIGEIASAQKVKQLICDVDMELKYLDRFHIELESVGYDLKYIYMIQNEIHEKYKEKTEKLGIDIC